MEVSINFLHSSTVAENLDEFSKIKLPEPWQSKHHCLLAAMYLKNGDKESASQELRKLRFESQHLRKTRRLLVWMMKYLHPSIINKLFQITKINKIMKQMMTSTDESTAFNDVINSTDIEIRK